MLSVGMIGTGGISKAHLDYLKTRTDVSIAALCDVRADSLERRVKEFGGTGYHDFRAMLDGNRLDAVWLCTPPEVRRDPLLACAERHVPVFCEKPVERDEGRGEEIARELERQQARVQVGYVFRSVPSVLKLRGLLKDDAIHAVQSVYACDKGLVRDLPPWFYDRELSGGPLIDQATHNFDLLRRLLGEVAAVRGLARNPVGKKEPGYTIDEAIALSFAFESGLVGSHIHTWLADAWRNEIVLSGEKALYRIDLNKGKVTKECGAETLVFQQDGRRIFEYEDEVFLKQVETGDWAENPSDYRDGLKTLKLTLACNRAIEQ